MTAPEHPRLAGKGRVRPDEPTRSTAPRRYTADVRASVAAMTHSAAVRIDNVCGSDRPQPIVAPRSPKRPLTGQQQDSPHFIARMLAIPRHADCGTLAK